MMTLWKPVTVATALTTLAIAGCDTSTSSMMSMGSELNLGKGQYTILLDTAHGPSHHQRIQAYKRIIMSNMDWPGSDLLVVSREGEEATSLYYDTFESFDAATRRLKQIRRIQTQTGKKPFDTVHVQVVPVPGSRIGPPEWDLTSTKGAYTLCVGRWYNMPDRDFFLRRENAVLHCKMLREKGHEAYYYHGESESLVTVGLFGPDTVKVIPTGDVNQARIVDPRVRTLRQHPDLATFVENGWTRVDHVQQQKERRPVLDREGNPVRKQIKARSHLVRHPAGVQDGRTADTKQQTENPNGPIDRPGVPKPW
jgi:hypothetical protein